MNHHTEPPKDTDFEITASVDENGATHYQITVITLPQAVRLDKGLAEALPEMSRSLLKTLIEKGHVKCNNTTVSKPRTPLHVGDNLTIDCPPAQETWMKPQKLPLNILYEDEHVLVLNKPAGLVVHPAPGNRDSTLVNALINHVGEDLAAIGDTKRPGIVHRLDKDTSGVMVVAKTNTAYLGLTEQFAARTVQKIYLAFIWGLITPPEGRIEGNIGRSPYHRKKMVVLSEGGKVAETLYKTRQFYPPHASMIECDLLTGRTHQIRVHLAHKKHTILGDPLYGRSIRANTPPELAGAIKKLNRQALHAHKLNFKHPITKEDCHFEAELPEDFKNLMKTLETLTQNK